MVPVVLTAKPQLAFCVGETPARCGAERIGLFSPAQNRQRFYFRCIVNCGNSLDGAFDSETVDAQDRLLSNGFSFRKLYDRQACVGLLHFFSFFEISKLQILNGARKFDSRRLHKYLVYYQ
jgi:hypothetical protein